MAITWCTSGGQIIVFLLSALASGATITERAVLPRAETTQPPELIGYTETSAGKYESWDCRKSSAFQVIGSIGRCCLTGRPDCFLATSCVDGSIMAGADFSSTCTGSRAQTSCVTGTVYHSINDQNPIMNYQCWPEWDGGNWDATINTAEPTTSVSSSSTVAETSGSAPGSGIAQSIAESTSTSPSETGAALAAGAKSKAWIAGPVIGGLLGAVFFTFFGIWLYKRHVRQKEQHTGGYGQMEMDASQERSARYAYIQGGGERKALGGADGGEYRGFNGSGSGGGVAELSGQGIVEAYGSRPKTMLVEADGSAVGTEQGGQRIRR